MFRISEQNFSAPGPFPQIGEKKVTFLSFLPNYYLAIASGAHNLVASERKWQEVSEMV